MQRSQKIRKVISLKKSRELIIMQTILWTEWCKAFSALRTAFSRQTTFWWAMLYCAGLTITQGFRGVSSIVDHLGLSSASYHSLLRLAQSNAINLDKLTDCWVNACLSMFRPVCVGGYLVVIGDGVKVAKEGKKMPAVKLMHQSSQSNSKAEFIMGHYFQSLSMLVNAPNKAVAAIPLIAKIHDGLVYSNRSQETVMTRMTNIVAKIADSAQVATMLVADAYYANTSMVHGLDEHGCHLVSRVAHNTVAYEPAPQPSKRKRGRPRVKGMKDTKRVSKTYLHRETASYRAKVNRKLRAFHTHVALGCIAQGLLQHLSINFSSAVWSSFSGWLRTIRNDINPSEIVVSNALRTTFPNFLIAAGRHCEWRKFILKRLCCDRTGIQAQVANWE